MRDRNDDYKSKDHSYINDRNENLTSRERYEERQSRFDQNSSHGNERCA